ncbi:hypothetical protein [Hydrogenophaga sp. NFH-34]|uniref:hypothetical protein n=1 Tax=Hydrogenophaga sp. NFH-34 TaxID=2744446 RepID=UPI001F29981C|nr:hypothetical protein [Hydrogenophaga sp. NFH-34]
MTSATPFLSRRSVLRTTLGATLGLTAGVGLLAPLSAHAAGRLVDVRVVNRDTDDILPVYEYRGELWVPGEPGARYAIELRNRSDERLLNVVSVDGVNVVTGETAAFDQAGYVIAPWQRYEVNGWRKSRREIAAFEFTRLSRSYAARTGRPDDVGVIGIAVFREERDNTPWRNPDARPYDTPYGRNAPAPAPQNAPPAELHGRSLRAEPGPQLGTGHGDREYDRVAQTRFDRRSDRPDDVVLIRYDSRANLVAMGIIPPDRHPPRPFPGERRGRWVPDPR